MHPYVIFPAGPGDAEALAAMEARSWRESYGAILPRAYLESLTDGRWARRWRGQLLAPPPTVTLAAADARGIVGLASGGKSRGGAAGEAEICELYILRRAQEAGLGRDLMTACGRALSAAGFTSLAIWVLEANAHARGFYLAMGGTAGETRREPFRGFGVTTIVYRWPDLAALTAQGSKGEA